MEGIYKITEPKYLLTLIIQAYGKVGDLDKRDGGARARW
jgi:hypothetical protein